MKLSALRERVLAAVRGQYDSEAASDRLVSLVVDLTLAGVDLHVDRDDEVYSPAPEARFMPSGMEAKWGGGSRRRRRGR